MPDVFGRPERSHVTFVAVDHSTAARVSRTPDTASALTPAAHAAIVELARVLAVPVALLSRDDHHWRFEGDAYPAVPAGEPSHDAPLTDGAWTGVVVGRAQNRDWVVVLPGDPARWSRAQGIAGLVEGVARSLETVAETQDVRCLVGFGRRLYAFTRRLARPNSSAALYGLILRTFAREVSARVGAVAVYLEGEQALAINATVGYPLAIVDHLRISPGAGIIGQSFTHGRPAIGRSDPSRPKRLRYRTDSYLTVPLVAADVPLAVVALTDKADGGPFTQQDLAALRMLAGPAALALARERATESLNDVTRAATVDAVSGLFNRRYFESRVQAEVQRAIRQQQDLALLMVDVDDFKRINDTLGHVEGDRALREVADQLRGGVRIFDVCARYGGEEFAIVMPGAGRTLAMQIAERIRRGIEDNLRFDQLPITVSIGVGFLGPGESAEDLVGAADRALIAAKRAGKNVVQAAQPVIASD